MNEKNLVTKANILVTSRYSLSLAEQRIILTLASLVQPDDEEFKPYEFKVSEFMQLLGLTGHSKYTDIKKITKELMQKVFEIRQGTTTIQLAWLSSARYEDGLGTVILKFSPDLKPFLLGLKEFFTTYRLENILELTGKYSIRIYEILKSNEFKKTLEIEITDLVRILKLTKTYFTFQHLRERIVEPAKKEINAKTDIMFDYEPIKSGKKVTALKFTIKPNLKNRAKQEQETPKQLTKLWNPDIADDLRADIQSIQSEFQKRYKGELLDKFVEKMLAEKGYQNVQKCIRDYEDYIQGRNIKNISGDFYRFVIDGYQKPTQYKGNKPQRDNFEQREYSREELEKYYVDLAAIDIEDKTVKDEPTVKTIEDNKPETELPRREKSNPILENIKSLFKKL